MSAFKDDQSSEAQKHMIGDIRRAIECGDTCFLMYTEAIHGSLYDLFNQFFTVQRDRDQNAKLYVQIGIGSYSKVWTWKPQSYSLADCQCSNWISVLTLSVALTRV